MLEQTLVYAIAFFATLGLIQLLRQPATRIGLVDYPGGRKIHHAAIPVVGGVAIYSAFILVASALGKLESGHFAFLSAAFLLLVVGVTDDWRDLSASSRFIAQMLATVFMTSWGGLYVPDLGNLFGTGPIVLHDWAIPFTAFGVIGVINALNMTDGIDGLAGGLTLLSLLLLAMVAQLGGMALQFPLLLVLAGSVGGFLVFNFPHPWRKEASIFLGDAGSMMLGFCLAWFAVDLSHGKNPVMPPIIAVWILAVPLLDTVSIMIRRMLRGGNPFAADRGHLHHLLLRAGYSAARSVSLILVLALLLGCTGIAGWYFRVPEYLMFYGFIGVFAVYYYLLDSAWRKLPVEHRGSEFAAAIQRDAAPH